MKRLSLLFSLLLSLLVLVLTACGGTTSNPNTTSMNMGGSPMPGGTMGTTTTGGEGSTVQVRLAEFQITSSRQSFLPGTTYHFVVTNGGKVTHEFMITPADMMPGMSMDDMHKVALLMIDTLAPGETKTVEVTFPSSVAGKSLELACHLPGHYEAGMKLGITVAK